MKVADTRGRLNPQRKGRRHKLTQEMVDAAEPGAHADGHGLYLHVVRSKRREKHHVKSWSFTYKFQGKYFPYRGLGPARALSLIDARKIAARADQLISQGIDPAEFIKQSAAGRRTGSTKSSVVATAVYDALCKMWGVGFIRECFGDSKDFDTSGVISEALDSAMRANTVPIANPGDTPQ